MGKKKQKKFDDTQSEISSINGSTSTYQSTAGGKQFDSEEELDDDMRFKEAVDGISAKNSKVSQPSLKHVKSQMQKEYMITLLSDYYQTLSTEIYRALKKAKGEFQSDLFKTMSILFLSISADDANSIYSDVQRELLDLIKTGKPGSAMSLAICSSVQFNPEEVLPLTEQLRKRISRAYLKGDGTVPLLKSSEIVNITECIDAWTFLIAATFQSPGFMRFIRAELDFLAPKIEGILQQGDVELRIAAGEAISIMYEVMRDYESEWDGFDNHEIIVESLMDLASGVAVGGGSVKDTAKKERKAQRTSFRHILDFVQDDCGAPITVLKLNRQEELELENFCDLKKHSTLCWCFESGITAHLTRNELLRSNDWFCLGAIMPNLTSLDRDINSKGTKLERQVARGYESKARDAQIKRNRIHRTDDHYYE